MPFKPYIRAIANDEYEKNFIKLVRIVNIHFNTEFANYNPEIPSDLELLRKINILQQSKKVWSMIRPVCVLKLFPRRSREKKHF